MKKIYFASDFHLGAPNMKESIVREKIIVKWLKSIENNLSDIFLLGDIFDFWFEYRRTAPQGFTRFLGQLAKMSDEGVNIHIFKGNHDFWFKDYIQNEINAKIYSEPTIFEFNKKRFYLAHGDGLGPNDTGYKILKKVLGASISRFLFYMLHPDLGIYLAMRFSKISRKQDKSSYSNKKFFGEDEWLIQHSKNILKTDFFDFFIFGHRHIPIEFNLGKKSKYINLGDMITHFTYAEFDGKDVILKKIK